MKSENPLLLANIEEKLGNIETACHQVLSGVAFKVPDVIARDVEVVPIKQLPAKKGVGSVKGQARLLHDLASIELQAMEMGFRSLVEFPDHPPSFREQLVSVVLDEARHLRLCVEQIQNLGFQWGSWPVHTALWQCLSSEDSFLDRIFIVHRYLEGSGLDASEKISRRLSDVEEKQTLNVVKMIADEEVGHVLFGSQWYHQECQRLGVDATEDFKRRSQSLIHRLPRRMEPINEELRKRAGFSDSELSSLRRLQAQQAGIGAQLRR